MIETPSSRDEFDHLAARYDAWYATAVGAWADRRETEAIFRLLALKSGERLLDVGAGTGRIALAAARRGAVVVGVDPSRAMLGVARRRLADRSVALLRADATRLPFADGSFEAAVAVTLLCFAADPAAVLREIARVLRPDGRLVLGELNRWSLWALVRRAEGLIRPTTYRAAHFRGIHDLRHLLLAAGLVPMGWEGLLHLPPVNHAGFLRALDPVERVGQRCCPVLGAFLAVEAWKPVSPL